MDSRYFTEEHNLFRQSLADFLQKEEFEEILNNTVKEVEDKIKTYEERLKERINTYGIKLLTEIGRAHV